MTAADQATAAAIAAALTPAQIRALRDAGNGLLYQDSRGTVRGTAGMVQPRTIDVLLGRGSPLVGVLRRQTLIRLTGDPLGTAACYWELTELGAAVLAWLDPPDGA